MDWREKFKSNITLADPSQLDVLSEREKMLFHKVHEDNQYSLRQLGELIGVSSNRVGQILDIIVKKLKGESTSIDKPKVTLTHTNLMELTVWVQANKDRLWGLPIEAMTAMVKKDIDMDITDKTMAQTCKVLKIEVKPKPRSYHVPESARCQVLARALIKIYTELNVTVPDEIWAMIGGVREE